MKKAFNQEMFFELLSFWPAEEAEQFEKEFDLMIEKDEQISSQPGGGVPPKAARGNPAASNEAPPKAARGQSSSDAPPKAQRGQTSSDPPPKAARGMKPTDPTQKPTSINQATLKHGTPVVSAGSRTLANQALAKESDNPFLDDDLDDTNPFLDEKPSNPFEDDDETEPADGSNPFLDDAEEDNSSSNPFLD